MKREQFTANFPRIIRAIESGSTPAKVKELYVFGSYVRGALEPGDLDLIVIYEQPGEAYWKALEAELEDKCCWSELSRRVLSRFKASMRRALRKPGERVSILLERELSYVVGDHSTIKPEDIILLWSEQDRDWRPKLDAIKPDPSAGRAPRHYILSLGGRVRDWLRTMEEVASMLTEKRLTLTRIPIEAIDCRRLNRHHTWRVERLAQGERAGRQTLRLLPYVFWWFEQYRQRADMLMRTEIWSESRTLRAHLGQPSLNTMLWYFENHPRVKRQCLLLHIKTKQPNELLIFERGPRFHEPKPKRLPGV